MNILKNLSLIFVLAILLSSCAISRSVTYDNLKMDFSNVKEKSVSFALLDHRVQVIDGSRKPDFVGYMRSGVGIAYPMGTSSKNNFIDDLTAGIVASLERVEVIAVKVETSWNQSEKEVREKLFRLNNFKKVFIVFDELHTDGYAIQVLHYDFSVFVYNQNNELLKMKTFKKTEKLGGTVMWGAGPYKKYMPEALVRLFETVFSDEEISTAING